MIIEALKILFKRDLNKLKTEIGLYQNEEKIWYVEKNIPNSAGNLCLHLVGNLNTFIGAHIGKTDYVRNREAEFSLKNIPKAELLRMVEETIEVVDKALDCLTEADLDGFLDSNHPMFTADAKIPTGHFLMHLAIHLGYHLGQINYHRRLLDL